MSVQNLDQNAAHYAQEIVRSAKVTSGVNTPVDTLERLVTKTLGVLQEQGVYAMMLFLYSRTSEEAKIAPAIRGSLFHLLRDKDHNHSLPGFQDKDVPQGDADARTALKFYTEHVLGDLDGLLLIRDLYEQTLIYARYGAKAAGTS